jgi:hypothetical protein
MLLSVHYGIHQVLPQRWHTYMQTQDGLFPGVLPRLRGGK